MPGWIMTLTAVFAAVISFCIGIFLVPMLHKLHFGQPIKIKNGPKWHEKKQGTPTMGGFMFIISSILCAIIGFCLWRAFGKVDFTIAKNANAGYKMLACIIFCLLFAAIGFSDDFIKVAKKHNLGLKAYQKIILQLAVSCAFLIALWFIGDRNTDINLSFVSFNAGIFYYPLMLLLMIFLTNAVNLTDGIDGLAGSVTVICMLFFTVASTYLKYYSMTIYAIAVAGSLVGFLYWNYNPAKCFMGDTGSMYLGAVVTSIGIVLHRHLVLILFALVYICEALSVVIQVSYFKYTKKKTGTGKRIFKMTPIHHHFELSGFNEYKICLTFSIAGFVFGLLGMLALVFGK